MQNWALNEVANGQLEADGSSDDDFNSLVNDETEESTGDNNQEVVDVPICTANQEPRSFA